MCPAPFKATRRSQARAKPRARRRHVRIVGARHHDARKRQPDRRHRREARTASTRSRSSRRRRAPRQRGPDPAPPAAATRCATSAQPRLWATSTGGAAHAAISRSSVRATPRARQQPVTLQHAKKASSPPPTGSASARDRSPVPGSTSTGGRALMRPTSSCTRRAQRTTTGPHRQEDEELCHQAAVSDAGAPATLALMAVTRQSARRRRSRGARRSRRPTRSPAARAGAARAARRDEERE